MCQKWAAKYKWPIFQIRLGNMRAIVVNTFETSREMLIDHSNQVVDRPTLYTFHGLISSTQGNPPKRMWLTVGFTIGSSPYDESCKKRRKAAATALAKPAMRKYLPMFDLETFCVIRDYFKMAISSEGEFNPRPFLQRFALNTTLTLCYGIRMDDAYDELLREILCMFIILNYTYCRCWQRDIFITKCVRELSGLHSRKESLVSILKVDTSLLP